MVLQGTFRRTLSLDLHLIVSVYSLKMVRCGLFGRLSALASLKRF